MCVYLDSKKVEFWREFYDVEISTSSDVKKGCYIPEYYLTHTKIIRFAQKCGWISYQQSRNCAGILTKEVGFTINSLDGKTLVKGEYRRDLMEEVEHPAVPRTFYRYLLDAVRWIIDAQESDPDDTFYRPIMDDLFEHMGEQGSGSYEVLWSSRHDKRAVSCEFWELHEMTMVYDMDSVDYDCIRRYHTDFRGISRDLPVPKKIFTANPF